MAKNLNCLSKTTSPNPKTNIHAIHTKFMPSSPSNLTEKHSYEVNTDSLILSHQLHDQRGMPQESI